MHANRRVQARRRLPGPIPHARDPFARHARRVQGHAAAVAGHHIPWMRQVADLDLQAFDRRVDVARRSRSAGFLAQHVPRLDRLTQFKFDPVQHHLADPRKAELEMRSEPRFAHGQADLLQFPQDLAEVLEDKVRQHEAVVQRSAPADQRLAVGLVPEARDQRPHQQLLGQAHPGVRRHLKRPELDQAQPAAGRIGRVQFVDAELGPMRVAGNVHQQVAEDPIDQPGRACLGLANLAEGDFQLV